MDRIFDILIMIIAAMFGAVAIGGAAGFGLWYFTEARPKKKNGRKRK